MTPQHAVLAMKLLEAVTNQCETISPESAIAAAQIHATLAVAQEQRIASMIAVIADSDHYPDLSDTTHASVRTQIGQHLGLLPTESGADSPAESTEE